VFRADGPGDGDITVLLVSSKKEPGNWIFPKGHVERGESAAEAALRETEEEAGVDGALVGPVGALEFEWRGRRYQVVDVSGRWRIEGRWWSDGRDREYWRVEARGGAVWDLYHDRQRNRWHMERLWD